jgi:alanyl-tRNA synthetase
MYLIKQDGDRLAVIMNQTIMYPQGGGQPCDTGAIISVDSQQKFRVEDVRSKSGLV